MSNKRQQRKRSIPKRMTRKQQNIAVSKVQRMNAIFKHLGTASSSLPFEDSHRITLRSSKPSHR